MKNLKLIKMTEIETQEVQWLWHPYIPFGKITIIQGVTVKQADKNGPAKCAGPQIKRRNFLLVSCGSFPVHEPE